MSPELMFSSSVPMLKLSGLACAQNFRFKPPGVSGGLDTSDSLEGIQEKGLLCWCGSRALSHLESKKSCYLGR